MVNIHLLEAVCGNNVEMIKLLIEYTIQHQTILEMNEKNEF